MNQVTLRVSQVVTNMAVLGYGQHRFGVWTQGCNIGCPGCTSLNTHPDQGGRLIPMLALLNWFAEKGDLVSGLTISGGEPTAQPDSVLQLINGFRKQYSNVDVLMYSGLTWQTLTKKHPDLVNACDVVVAGPYAWHLPPLPLRGSSNQTIHLLTDLAAERYSDVETWPIHATQVMLGENGLITLGIPKTDLFSKALDNTGLFDLNTASWQSMANNRANEIDRTDTFTSTENKEHLKS